MVAGYSADVGTAKGCENVWVLATNSILTADGRKLKLAAKCFTTKGAKIAKTMLLLLCALIFHKFYILTAIAPPAAPNNTRGHRLYTLLPDPRSAHEHHTRFVAPGMGGRLRAGRAAKVSGEGRVEGERK